MTVMKSFVRCPACGDTNEGTTNSRGEFRCTFCYAILPAQDAEQSEPFPDQADAVEITAAAAELMTLNGINPADVKGTGTDGRILKSDVEAFIEAS